MTAQAGRKCLIKIAGTKIAGGQTVGLTWNGAGIDITDEGSAQFQEFLEDELSTDTLELSFDGMEKDSVIRTAALSTDASAKHFADLTFEFPGGDTVSGKFVMTNYSSTGAYQDAQKFSAKFVRNGAHTFTAGAAA